MSSGDIESAAEIGRTPAAAIYESKSTAPIAISIEKASSSDSPITSPVASSDGWFSRFGIKKPQKEAYLGKSNR